VVPALRPDRCLNLHKIHPGRRMKADAVAAGAGKRVQDATYRSGMSRWQNVYRYEVSRRFGHDRFGPRRRRVSRTQRQMEKRMEEAKARQAAALAAGIAAFERTQAVARAATEREVTREFKLEAVRLIKERGVSFAQASQDLSVHESRLRNWVKAFADDPQYAFPGQGRMKPELQRSRQGRSFLSAPTANWILTLMSRRSWLTRVVGFNRERDRSGGCKVGLPGGLAKCNLRVTLRPYNVIRRLQKCHLPIGHP
jgi:transposase